MDHAARSPGCPSVQQPAGGAGGDGGVGGGGGGQAREGMGEPGESRTDQYGQCEVN